MKKTLPILTTLLMVPLTVAACSVPQESSSNESTTPSQSQKEESSDVRATTLASVTNVAYEDGILSFDGSEGATKYEITLKHGDEIVYEDTITDASIDIESVGEEGNLTISIVAANADSKSPAAVFNFTVLTTFGDVELEAEDYLYNFGTGKSNSNFRNNSLAHKGAYVGGIDDAGQGVYINYLSPIAGTFDFTVYYCHEGSGAHQDMWVNGEFQKRIDYTKNTGWGGATFNAADVTVPLTLKEGWNTISIMKNGDASDNWGDFAELDYFVIHGDGTKYNVDDLAKYGVRPSYYRLEAEMGSPRCKNKVSNIVQCKNPAIVEKDGKKFSNGFILGNIESNYDGIEWQFYSETKAKYEITLAYAAGEFEGSKKAKPSLLVTQSEVGLAKGVDFEEKNRVTFDPLPYTGWDNITVAEQKVEIELEAGKNFIYLLKMDSADSGIFQVDYIDAKFISEIVDGGTVTQ